MGALRILPGPPGILGRVTILGAATLFTTILDGFEMGKRVGEQPRIPDAVIFQHLKNREALNDDLWLVPAQVSMLLGKTERTLEEDRKNGNPPPFMKPWGVTGPTRYTVGAVRDYLTSQATFNTTLEAKIALSFGQFLDTAGPNDEWPFLIHQGTPIDLFKSLTLGDALTDEDTAAILTLDDYLTKRRDAAWAHEAAREAAEVRAFADAEITEPLPSLNDVKPNGGRL